VAHDEYSPSLTRRDLQIKGGKTASATGTGFTLSSMLIGCATTGLKEVTPVTYPALRGHKIQPPSDGCMFGFRCRTFEPKRIIESYGKKMGRKPSIFILSGANRIFSNLPMANGIETANEGVIPFAFLRVASDLAEIIEGKHDQEIKRFSDGAVEFGQKYGGFFINTMWEMNVDRRDSSFIHPWCRQPKAFQDTWKHIWQLFEDRGANEYATWMIEYHVDYPLEGYYPGDAFVDWVGFSAYNRAIFKQSRGYRSLNDLISGAYDYFREKCGNKPIMQAEFGTTIGSDQPKWLINALQTIKSKPGMRAAIYWDNAAPEIGDDHTLSEESCKALQEILKDPYFIMVN
jgi:hypothetical protein